MSYFPSVEPGAIVQLTIFLITMSNPTPHPSPFLSNLVENLHQVKAAMSALGQTSVEDLDLANVSTPGWKPGGQSALQNGASGPANPTMKTTRVETNNVPGLTSAVRGQEGRGETYNTVNSMMQQRSLLDTTPAGRNLLPVMGGFPKRASTAFVRAIRKGLLGTESINRAAQAMKPGTSRFIHHLGRGQFNLADEMVGNIAGKGRVAVRKLPSFNYARLKDAYTPIQADIRKMNKMFPQSTGNPLIAEYLNIGRKGAFQQHANQATDLKKLLPESHFDARGNLKTWDAFSEGTGNFPKELPSVFKLRNFNTPKALLGKIKKQMWDVRPGNTGPKGQIFDYISTANPGVGTVPYKTTRLVNPPFRLTGHPNPVVAPPRKALDVKVGPSHPQGMNDPRDGHWVDDLISSPDGGNLPLNARINNLIRKHWLGGTKTGAEMHKEAIGPAALLIPAITGGIGSLGTAAYRGITGQSQGLGKDLSQGFWNWSGANMLPSNLINSNLGDAKTGWMPSMWGARGEFGSQSGMSNAQRGAYQKMAPEQQKQYQSNWGEKSQKWQQHPAARTNKPGGWMSSALATGGGGAASLARHMPYYAAGGGAYRNSIAPPSLPQQTPTSSPGTRSAIENFSLGNAPSALRAGGKGAAVAGMRKGASVASMGRRILSKFLGKPAKPIFGKAVAEQAKEHGLGILGNMKRKTLNTLNKANQAKGQKVYYGAPERYWIGKPGKLPKELGAGKTNKGVVINFSGIDPAEAKQVASTGATVKGLPSKGLRALEDKLLESEQLKDIAKSVSISKIMKKYRIGATGRDAGERLQAALRKELGGRFIIKPTRGFASAGGSLPTEKTEAKLLMDMLRGRAGAKNIGNNQGSSWGKPSQFLAQKRHDLQKNSLIETLVNRLIHQRKAGNSAWKSLKNAVTGKNPEHMYSVGGGQAKEWRVHATGGKVIPYATSGRGSFMGMLPWHTKNRSLAEDAAQKMLNKFPKKYREASFGMDLAKTKDGRFVLIESNPTTVTGSSGLLPVGKGGIFNQNDAVEAAVMGRLPKHIKFQRGLKTTGAAGGVAGAGVLGADALSPQQPDTEVKYSADEGSSGFLGELVRNLRDATLVGAGGVSAGTSADILRKQLKHIKQYNPTIVSASPNKAHPKSVLKLLSKIRDGDVMVSGEAHRPGRKLSDILRSTFGGGMGGFDDHAAVITNEPGGGLRSVVPTRILDNPKGRRTPWVPAADKARKTVGSQRGRKQLFRDPVKAIKRIYARYQNAQAQSKKGLTADQLNRTLRTDTVSTYDDLLNLAHKREAVPFSILRPKEYDRAKTHKYLREVGNTTFDALDTAQAAQQRRFAPRWATDLLEKVRTKLRPGASQQGTNCAGGVCKALTGKGTYNLPSDLRQMKEFDTVMDVLPEHALKRMGGTPKNLAPVRKIMRRGAFGTSVPGLLGGLGLAGLGIYGAMNRK